MIHYDGVHANDLGHGIVANRIFEVLARNCSGLAKKTKEAEKSSPRWRDESMLKADYATSSSERPHTAEDIWMSRVLSYPCLSPCPCPRPRFFLSHRGATIVAATTGTGEDTGKGKGSFFTNLISL